ncbi:Holliday junction resolvase RuvX [Litorilinea aerophila]|uniref:Putative pre-16S rRNA nuclease n=1 Tax=Litorilinea aerophila TaxID=1204385 RepID=A0A540VIL2_9CHLR|nr:Holliday junction resolvase RuvX [Litorilinea aerophila]MCC9075835.1 Holliday junction resolvase RuvX [Litorilinea aerophila]GIV77234.1 MAG: putative pre-16S rRNA nuclease [Litorilinea sp.]
MNPPETNPPGKLLAVDVGLARIGVAKCDPLGLAAHPLTVIHRTSRRADFAKLAQLVTEEEAQAVICGLPLNMDGSEGPQARSTRRWAERLAYALRTLVGRPIPVIFWDERLSTFAAQEWMAAHDLQRGQVAEDAVAAAVILQSYLDARRQPQPRDFGRIDLPPRDPAARDQDASKRTPIDRG